MPYLSPQTMQRIAAHFLAEYWDLPNVDRETATCIDPELLATKVLGLTIEYWLLSPDGSILGLTTCMQEHIGVFDENGNRKYVFMTGTKVLIDQRLVDNPDQLGRYHFTLTHESVHQIFKMLFPAEYLLPKVHFCMKRTRGGPTDWEEWRTDRVASLILMPEELIRRNMTLVGLNAPIHNLNRIYAPKEYDAFCKIAQNMGVSKTALAIRMKELGLVKNNYLKDPHELTRITADESEQF